MGFLGLLAAGMTSFSPQTAGRGSAGSTPDGFIDTVIVRRMDLETTLLAGGDLMPAKQTGSPARSKTWTGGRRARKPGDGHPGALPPMARRPGKGTCSASWTPRDSPSGCGWSRSRIGSARSDHRHAELTVETAGAALAGSPGRGRSSSGRRRPRAGRPCSVPTSRANGPASPGPSACFQKGYRSTAPILGTRQALVPASTAHEWSVAVEEWRVFRLFTAAPRRSAGSRARSRGPGPLSASNRCG